MVKLIVWKEEKDNRNKNRKPKITKQTKNGEKK
jgi:hypothetical protein